MLEGKDRANEFKSTIQHRADAYEKLKGLSGQMRDAGYVPDTRDDGWLFMRLVTTYTTASSRDGTLRVLYRTNQLSMKMDMETC
ncbi:hypothetical protein K7X08_020984 [Anisodus acutangulus]|uniref:Uncharacterized protein n=1 Tax=Anisodus acutangulus TaxID=402998 RepID=A0A9Q1MZJ0_9SOLA|nr:hypothetical protein K7X08_020984 [Anisodus acutangulus]